MSKQPEASKRPDQVTRLLVLGFTGQGGWYFLANEAINLLGEPSVVVFEKRRVQHV